MPKPRISNGLPKLLLQARAELELTLEEVAKMTRLSVMTISNVERERFRPRRSTQFRIEQFLRKFGYLAKEAA